MALMGDAGCLSIHRSVKLGHESDLELTWLITGSVDKGEANAVLVFKGRVVAGHWFAPARFKELIREECLDESPLLPVEREGHSGCQVRIGLTSFLEQSVLLPDEYTVETVFLSDTSVLFSDTSV